MRVPLVLAVGARTCPQVQLHNTPETLRSGPERPQEGRAGLINMYTICVEHTTAEGVFCFGKVEVKFAQTRRMCAR